MSEVESGRWVARVVSTCDAALVREAAALHYEALSYRSFITTFGLPFLEQLYGALLDLRVGFLVVAEDQGRFAGFLLACEDSSRLMSVVPRQWYRFLPRMVGPIVRRPALLRNLVQTLSYARREASPVTAELVVIAVRPPFRSQGVGRVLLGELEREFARRGTTAYKVTVHDAMERSNGFYTANGFVLERYFQFYGVTWNLYIKRVGPS